MKNLIILCFILTNILNAKQTIPITKEYINFFYSGGDNKYFSPLFISKYPLNLRLQKTELNQLVAIQKQIPKITEKDFIKSHYDLLVTDSTTYSETLNFIENHTEYYTNYTNQNINGYREIGILANGHLYHIYRKYQRDFFAQLTMKLNQKKCDKKLIETINKSYDPH